MGNLNTIHMTITNDREARIAQDRLNTLIAQITLSNNLQVEKFKLSEALRIYHTEQNQKAKTKKK